MLNYFDFFFAFFTIQTVVSRHHCNVCQLELNVSGVCMTGRAVYWQTSKPRI